MSEESKEIELGWYLIKKTYRGGGTTYAFRVTSKIKEAFADWDELFQYIGDNTDGGHEGGWNLNADACESKPKAEKTLSFKTVTRQELSVD